MTRLFKIMAVAAISSLLILPVGGCLTDPCCGGWALFPDLGAVCPLLPF
jgi:hypothetical protein